MLMRVLVSSMSFPEIVVFLVNLLGSREQGYDTITLITTFFSMNKLVHTNIPTSQFNKV